LDQSGKGVQPGPAELIEYVANLCGAQPGSVERPYHGPNTCSGNPVRFDSEIVEDLQHRDMCQSHGPSRPECQTDGGSWWRIAYGKNGRRHQQTGAHHQPAKHGFHKSTPGVYDESAHFLKNHRLSAVFFSLSNKGVVSR